MARPVRALVVRTWRRMNESQPLRSTVLGTLRRGREQPFNWVPHERRLHDALPRDLDQGLGDRATAKAFIEPAAGIVAQHPQIGRFASGLSQMRVHTDDGRHLRGHEGQADRLLT